MNCHSCERFVESGTPWTAWHWNVIAAWELDLPTQGRYACMSRHQNLAHRKMQWRSCQVQLPVPRCKLISNSKNGWVTWSQSQSISMFLKHVPSLPPFGHPAPPTSPVISRRLTHPMPRGNIAALRPDASVQHGPTVSQRSCRKLQILIPGTEHISKIYHKRTRSRLHLFPGTIRQLNFQGIRCFILSNQGFNHASWW